MVRSTGEFWSLRHLGRRLRCGGRAVAKDVDGWQQMATGGLHNIPRHKAPEDEARCRLQIEDSDSNFPEQRRLAAGQICQQPGNRASRPTEKGS